MGNINKVCTKKSCLISKLSYPMISEGSVIGSIAEYRVLGILLFRKVEEYPMKHGVASWDYYKSI